MDGDYMVFKNGKISKNLKKLPAGKQRNIFFFYVQGKKLFSSALNRI